MAQIRKNNSKAKLAAGEVVTALASADDPELIDFLGPAGFDAVWIEAEHGPVDHAQMGNLTRACDLWGMNSIVRVGWAEPNIIYRALDRGAQGVCVPHVNTRQEAELIVDSAKYVPVGHRGMSPNRQGYAVGDYLERANDETMIVVLIEDIKAVQNLDEILTVDHIDVFHVASSDLAQSMGLLGQQDSPQVRKIVDETVARILAAGRTAGTTVTAQTVGPYIDAGVRFFYYSIYHALMAAATGFLDTVKAAKR